MNFDQSDITRLKQFLATAHQTGINGLSTEQELWQSVDQPTELLIKRILSLNLAEYGFKGKELPVEDVPTDAVTIHPDGSQRSGEYQINSAVFLPRLVNEAFTAMATAFNQAHPSRQLIVGSGYRSPAFQVVTLIYILVNIYDFELGQTLKRVALPQFSQHCSATKTAIDIINIDGQPTDEYPQQFSNSIEYQWLQKNAHQYGFQESYPPDNPDGIMWEPWHWQYIK